MSSDIQKDNLSRALEYLDRASQDVAINEIDNIPWQNPEMKPKIKELLTYLLARNMIIHDWAQDLEDRVATMEHGKSNRFSKIDDDLDPNIAKVAKLTEACQLVLDFYNMDTMAFVEKYGHGVNTRVMCDKIREAMK